MSKIEPGRLIEFSLELTRLRRTFPELAREVDGFQFEILKEKVGSCGHGGCQCQMSFEEFHAERNILLGTQSEAKSYEFN